MLSNINEISASSNHSVYIMKPVIWVLLCYYVLYFTVVDGAKILGMFFVPSISHQVVYQPIWKELSLRGYDVTVITPNPLKDPKLTNLTEIDVGHSYSYMRNEDFSKPLSHWGMFSWIYEAMTPIIENQLNNTEVQKLLKDNASKFDVVLTEFFSPIPTAFSAKFKCPLIGVASVSAMTSAYEYVGTPQHPVLFPAITLTFSHHDPNFFERVECVVFYLYTKFIYRYVLLPKMDIIAKKYFGNDLPYLEDIERNVSMLLLNTNPVIHQPQPLSPNVIELGRMHLKPKNTLPQELKHFLDSATEGVIYFSLGSNVKSALIDKNKRALISETFSELPYKVLWKFENDTLSGKSSNVMIKKWLPQQDLLDHANIKLFITQGGLQSMEEAISNGVPLLVMPFIGDQFYNSERVQKLGIGLRLDFKTLTKSVFKDSIMEIVGNPKYKKRAEEISKLLNDEPMSGLEKAVWWTEYVIRHKGAVYLKSHSVSMPWIQFLLLDVIAFLLAIILTFLYLLFRIYAFVKSKFFDKADINKKLKKR